MANDLTTIRFTNFDGLLNSGVSDFLMQNNELTACKNVWVNKIGKIERVPGYDEIRTTSASSSPSSSSSISISSSPSASTSRSVSSSPSSSISSSPSISISSSPSGSSSYSSSPSSSLSSSPSSSISSSPSEDSLVVSENEDVSYLHEYYYPSNRTSYLLATANSGNNLTVKYRTTGTWETVSGISNSWDNYADAKVSKVNYLGKVFMAGYKSGTTFLPNAVIDGTNFSTVNSSLTNMPQGKFLVRYRDLLYVLHAKTGGNVYPSRVYYSDEPVNYAISWDNLLTQFLDFGYDDGDIITGGAECFDRLVIFKNNSMWKYDESSIEQIAGIGCDSHRSIRQINRILYWFNREGFWRWRGGQPELISAKAQPFIDAITLTDLSRVIGAIYNGFEYRAYIGTVIVDDITYTNAWFCWDTRREKCYIRCTAHIGTAACAYTEGGKRRAYFGDNYGYVYKFANKIDNIYSDGGYEIDSFFITKAFDYGAPEMRKIVNEMTTFTKHSQNMKVAVDVDNRGEFKEANTQIIKNNIDNLNLVAGGCRYKYKFYQKGSGKSWEFEGFTISTKGVDTCK